MTQAAKQQDQITMVPINRLTSSPMNARKEFDPSEIIELAESIRKDGLIQPLSVRELDSVDFEIIAGERRFRACRLINTNNANVMNLIPCIIRDYSDEEAEAIQLAENIHRKDLTPMEECEAYTKLLKHHKTVQRVAEVVGKTPNYVYSRIQLKALIKEFQGYLGSGTLPIAQAVILAKLPEEQQKKLLKDNEIIDKNGKEVQAVCTVQGLKRMIADSVYIPLNSASFDLKDKKLDPKMGACTDCQFNTGCNTVLFSDITDESHCTKGSCFRGKTLKHINARVNQLKAAGEIVIMLYEENQYWGSNKKKVEGYEAVASCDFKISEKKTEGATIGIFIEQNRWNPKYALGQEVYLSDKPKEKSSSSSRNSRKDKSIPAEEIPIEMRERRMLKRFAKEDDLDKVEVRKLIMRELFKQKELKPSVIKDVAKEVISSVYPVNSLVVYRDYGINPEGYEEDDDFTLKMWGDDGTDSLMSKIKTEHDLLILILKCFTAHNLQAHQTSDVNLTDPEFDDLIKAAKEYKIDIKKLHSPFIAKREEERKIELADLEVAKKRAKEREKKVKKFAGKGSKTKSKKVVN
ncbi:MAG: ParB/RepB/Spo0J family partition protein [Melioribacteraceae bacterium]|nr:ParB/RepB/Spo0J family partition protein [Melioribacteraceae bacterium]